jgi:hypothetical protein
MRIIEWQMYWPHWYKLPSYVCYQEEEFGIWYWFFFFGPLQIRGVK